MIDIEEVKRRLGKRVQQLRKERGLTQEQLAEMIDRTVDTVGNIENGRASTKIETVCRLANALKVDLVDLLAATPRDQAVVDRILKEQLDKIKTEILKTFDNISNSS